MSRLLWLPDILRDAGVNVTTASGWEQRGAGDLDPRVIVDHHTAANPTPARPTPSLRVVTEGRPDVAGPLCNILTGGGPRYPVVIVASGRSNNAGKGSWLPHGALHNRHTIGHEVEHPGVAGHPIEAGMLETISIVDAAICRHIGWQADRCVAHREWAPGRKVDPIWSQHDHRARVAELLEGDDVTCKLEKFIDVSYRNMKQDPTTDPGGTAYWYATAAEEAPARRAWTWADCRASGALGTMVYLLAGGK